MGEWNVFKHAEQHNLSEKNKGWETVDMMDSRDAHVIPKQDMRQHQLSPSCTCGPQGTAVETFNGAVFRTVYQHNAWDKREIDV